MKIFCNKCKKHKNISEFYKSQRSSNKPRFPCKQCQKDYTVKYRKKHPLKTKKNYKNYYKRNKKYYNLKNEKWMKKNKKQRLNYLKKYNKLNRNKILRSKRNCGYKNRYGITLAQKEKIMKSQNNKCLSCGTDFSKLSDREICIDHDHHSMKIRGILCSNCNLALGLLGEDHNKILKLAKYLKKYC